MNSYALSLNFRINLILKILVFFTEHRRAAAEQSTLKLEKAIKSYEDTLKKFPQNADGHALYAQVSLTLSEDFFPIVI